MPSKKSTHLFLKDIPTGLLINIYKSKNPPYISSVCKGICTSSAGSIRIKKLEKKGLLTIKDIGRTRLIELTPKGQDLIIHINYIVRLLDEVTK